MLWGGQTDLPTQNSKTDFSLIEYLETHEVETYDEFTEVIQSVSPESVEDMNEATNVTSFNIEIDYEDRVVSVTTIGEVSMGRSQGASNSASKTYYSDIGVQIFRITVEGTFSYSSGRCSALSNGGSFSKPFYSTWSSTPSYTRGNISTSKAYVRTSGTATSSGSSRTYSLTLTCDDSGVFSSY